MLDCSDILKSLFEGFTFLAYMIFDCIQSCVLTCLAAFVKA